MAAALLLPLLVGSVAAEGLFVPDLNNFGKKLLNTDDPGYKVCTAANSYVNQCIAKVGGQSALSTVADSQIAPCVCCIGTTDVAPVYSTCSSYLSAQNPLMTTQISAYSVLYSVCSVSPKVCAATGAGSGSSQASKTADITTPTKSATNNGASQSTSPPMITSAPTSATPVKECTDMLNLFTSCTYNTPGFASMAFQDQASCYCCRSSQGSTYSTDQLDQYAATCRDWAITGDSVNFYPVAKTFASFCHKFSDACSPATSTTPDARQTTPASTPTASAGPTTPAANGASNLGAGCAVGMVAFGAAFIAML